MRTFGKRQCRASAIFNGRKFPTMQSAPDQDTNPEALTNSFVVVELQGLTSIRPMADPEFCMHILSFDNVHTRDDEDDKYQYAWPVDFEGSLYLVVPAINTFLSPSEMELLQQAAEYYQFYLEAGRSWS